MISYEFPTPHSVFLSASFRVRFAMAFFPQHHRRPPPPPPPQPNTYSRNFGPGDGQTTAPIAFFSPTSFPDQSHPSFVHVMGLAPGSVPAADGGSNRWEPRSEKLEEQDFLENSQIPSSDVLQTGSVSTGLGLSLDDRRVAASSRDSPPPLLPMIAENIGRQVQRMDAEMDRFIKIEVERMRRSIVEKVQAKQVQTLATVEDSILRKMREKEAEVEEINKRNMELEEQMKQLAMEVSTWQHRAKYNENMIAHLKYRLNQVYAQSGDNKEGCGDSEVDDAASSSGGIINLQLMCKENKEMKDSMACKMCKHKEACMILLPCQHLCLCKECESKLSFCPLCRSSKFIGMEIYM